MLGVMKTSEVRVRFAPSPTGYLHIGGARTALYNWLFAKKHNGRFILRIEDTDEARSTAEAMRMQISDLKWLGLNWDEGPRLDTLTDEGPYGPYLQSARQKIYQDYAHRLLDSGRAYYCFLSDEEIEAQKKQAEKEGRAHQVRSPYRDWTLTKAQEKIKEGSKPVIRFKTPEAKSEYVLKDLVRGEVRFPSDMVGDFVLIRSSGMPVYNFCCVVDDALMKITHVLRAEEHLSNTLRQMMIYEALGFPLPEFGHLSIILAPDRQKLSKRHGATSCDEFRRAGFLPEAINNFIALLGWSSPDGREVLTLEEMIQLFSTDRMHSAGAVFDMQKLKWMNATHLRAIPHEELWQRLMPFFSEEGLQFTHDKAWVDRALATLKTSMETLRDGVSLFRFLSENGFQVTAEGRDVLAWDTSRSVIEGWREQLRQQSAEYLTEAQFLETQDRIKNLTQTKGKHLFMPIRVAVIGQPQGTELRQLVPLIPREMLIARANQALELC